MSYLLLHEAEIWCNALLPSERRNWDFLLYLLLFISVFFIVSYLK